jgi:hypothetical protein
VPTLASSTVNATFTASVAVTLKTYWKGCAMNNRIDCLIKNHIDIANLMLDDKEPCLLVFDLEDAFAYKMALEFSQRNEANFVGKERFDENMQAVIAKGGIPSSVWKTSLEGFKLTLKKLWDKDVQLAEGRYIGVVSTGSDGATGVMTVAVKP